MKTLISEVIETDRFRAFLEDFTKDTDDQSLYGIFLLFCYLLHFKMTWNDDLKTGES